MKIMVGCPIRNREWVFKEWLEHVLVAFLVCKLEPQFVFVVGSSEDATLDLVSEVCDSHPGSEFVVEEEHDRHLQAGDRVWHRERYRFMAHVRNRVLGLVRDRDPDYFLSLDSDMLIHPGVLSTAITDLTSGIATPHKGTRMWPNAVGAKAYLSIKGKIPNYANMKSQGGLYRPDQDGCFPVDVIMAIKLMDRQAYHVDYRYHQQGEDIGWSLACREAGLKLAWDGRIASKHIMTPEQLVSIDPRIGW